MRKPKIEKKKIDKAWIEDYLDGKIEETDRILCSFAAQRRKLLKDNKFSIMRTDQQSVFEIESEENCKVVEYNRKNGKVYILLRPWYDHRFTIIPTRSGEIEIIYYQNKEDMENAITTPFRFKNEQVKNHLNTLAQQCIEEDGGDMRLRGVHPPNKNFTDFFDISVEKGDIILLN